MNPKNSSHKDSHEYKEFIEAKGDALKSIRAEIVQEMRHLRRISKIRLADKTFDQTTKYMVKVVEISVKVRALMMQHYMIESQPFNKFPPGTIVKKTDNGESEQRKLLE